MSLYSRLIPRSFGVAFILCAAMFIACGGVNSAPRTVVVTTCPATHICAGVCVDLREDAASCGACGVACAADAVCLNGRCSSDCALSNLTDCDGLCRNISVDEANCGGCGISCKPGEVCSAGTCSATCAAGYASCTNPASDTDAAYCALLDRDSSNCGSCGTQCAIGAACTSGSCACVDPQTVVCGSGNAAGCVNLQTDAKHCGSCENACSTHARCEGGQCIDNDVPTPRLYTETIHSGSQTYAIPVGGTIDGVITRDPIGYYARVSVFEPNRSVRMRNIGNVPVKNPWLRIASAPDWRTQEGIVASALRPGMSDREKALAVWWQHSNYHFHATTNDSDNDSPIKLHNVYGYGICGNSSFAMACLYGLAGFSQVRMPWLQGHAIPEIWFDGRWNLLDGDEAGLHLLRDNYTIASNADIVRDHDLLKRSHSYGQLFPSSRQTDEFAASLFYSSNYSSVSDVFGVESSPDTMDMTLRPGESLKWIWGTGAKYHGMSMASFDMTAAITIANGEWSYHVDFTEPSWSYAVQTATSIVTDGGGLRSTSGTGSIIIPMQSPYVFVGGTVTIEGDATVYLSWDNVMWQGVPVSVDGTRLELDSFFPSSGAARYAYYLRLDVTGNPLYSIDIVNDVQMAPLAMPGLQLGDNTVIYHDETSVEHAVEITHEWIEGYSNRRPAAIVNAQYPADGATAIGTQLQFRWQPPTDPDGDAIVDYELILSDRNDVAWPLSSNFHRLVSLTADAGLAQLTLPYAGLLNSDTPYYWKVRGRDARGAWGPWSRIFSFKTVTPHPPTNVRLVVDSANRTATLVWDPSATGTRPVAYRIYGSDEKGFTASDDVYDVWTGNQPTAGSASPSSPFSGNLIKQLTATSQQVLGAGIGDPNTNKAYYRVVAVDANGVLSGASDYAEMPRPFLFTQPAAMTIAGQPYEYDAKSIASLGAVRSKTVNGYPYAAAYWDTESPVYTLPVAPAWLEVDAQSGVVSGVPPMAGTYEVQLAVQTASEVDVQSFTIEATDGP